MRVAFPFFAVLLLATACVSVPTPEAMREQAVAEYQRPQSVSGELTADQAVAIAVHNSPRLAVELAEIGIARAELIEATTISNPVFEFEIRFPGEPQHPYELRLAQSLFDLIQLPRRRALGRIAFEAAGMRVRSSVLRFAAGVRAQYYDVVAAQQNVAMTRTTLEAAQAAAEVALKQHAVENITDLDLENEQARYEQAKLDHARAEQRLVLAREALSRAINVQPTDWRVAASFPDLPPKELEQIELESLAQAQRLDLQIASREADLARRRIPLARLAALGEGEIDIHYEREPDGEHTVGPGIEIPIPIFNTGRAARTRAEAEYLRAQSSYMALLNESASTLRSARSTVAEARARVEYYRDVVLPRRRRIVELTKLEHNAMLVGVFQLLQAQQNELQSQRDFIDAQRDYWIARNDLDRAVRGVAGDTSFMPATDQGQGKRADINRGGH